MPRDIAPLASALEDATPGEQSDVYSLLAAWNQSIETALDRGGWSRLQEIRGQYLEDVIDSSIPPRPPTGSIGRFSRSVSMGTRPGPAITTVRRYSSTLSLAV